MALQKNITRFICLITDNSVKILKCRQGNFSALEVEALLPGTDDKVLAQKISIVLKRLGYNNNPIILSLPRNLATCRYLKIPTQSAQEIEKIVSLQASRYLPYPANELITGHQKIFTDKDGYSNINLVIVHKDVVDRYLKIFKEIKAATPGIILNSYGVCNFYNFFRRFESGPAMLIEIDSNYAEIAIANKDKLLFSRYIKINRSQPDWEHEFIEEVGRTQDAYLKEVSSEPLKKIVILGMQSKNQKIAEFLSKQSTLAVEILSFDNRIKLSENVSKTILYSEGSFLGLIGFGLDEMQPSLNILPQELKEGLRKKFQYKEQARLIMFAGAALLIWVAAIAKNLDNKAQYVSLIKSELNKIAKSAKPLEDMDRKIKSIETRKIKKTSILEMLHELYQIIPEAITLNNLNFEENSQLILRGQAQELNQILSFIDKLEKSPAFKKLSVRVRYATKKKSQAGEFVEFEIVCAKQ